MCMWEEGGAIVERNSWPGQAIVAMIKKAYHFGAPEIIAPLYLEQGVYNFYMQDEQAQSSSSPTEAHAGWSLQ